MRFQMYFFKLISRSCQKDLIEIEKLLLKDPMLMKRELGDPDTLVNIPNRYDHTPIYVASRNGHVELVKLLM
jgi:ankyrin repeat protein